MDNNILSKIKALPPLDSTIIQIQRICADKNSSLVQLISVVEGDPMLTANILKSANSPLYGFSKEIKNITHAVSLFGMATVRGFALSSAVKKNIKIDLSPYDLDNSSFLDISIAQSALAFNWISKVDRSMLDVLVPAAFMMEVGKLIVANEVSEQGLKESFCASVKTLGTPQEISNLEQQTVGFSNEEITAKIFEQWNLETELVESIRHSNTPHLAPAGISEYAFALQVIKNCINIFGKFTQKGLETSKALIAQNEWSEEIFQNAVEKVSQ